MPEAQGSKPRCTGPVRVEGNRNKRGGRGKHRKEKKKRTSDVKERRTERGQWPDANCRRANDGNGGNYHVACINRKAGILGVRKRPNRHWGRREKKISLRKKKNEGKRYGKKCKVTRNVGLWGNTNEKIAVLLQPVLAMARRWTITGQSASRDDAHPRNTGKHVPTNARKKRVRRPRRGTTRKGSDTLTQKGQKRKADKKRL